MIKALTISASAVICSVCFLVAFKHFSRNPAEGLLLNPTVPEQVKKIAAVKPGEMAPEEKRQIAEEVKKNRHAIHETMNSKLVPEDAKLILRENVRQTFRDEMMKRIDEYFALPESERDAYLEKMRAEMRPPGPPPGEGGPPGRRDGERSGSSLARIKEHIENSTPEERSKMARFHREMRSKMGPPPESPKQ